MHSPHGFAILRIELTQGRGSHEAGGVHEGVDRRHPIEHRGDALEVRQIDLYRFEVGRTGRSRRAIESRDLPFFAQQSVRDRGANAGAGARHQRALPPRRRVDASVRFRGDVHERPSLTPRR